ncbi:MAG: FGGY family carbohydrate kinase [Polyangiales bacterium]
MAGFLLSIDQGTTGTTAFVLSPEAKVLGKANREFPQHFPKPGWVEHDTDEIWASVLGAVRDALAVAKVEAKDCLAIGITNQRETTVLWDRTTGEAIHKAIVWQDRRTADRCRALATRATKPRFATERVWCSTPTSAAPSSRGFSTPCRARARRPRRGRSPSAPSTAGSSGAFSGGAAQRHRRVERVAHVALRHS